MPVTVQQIYDMFAYDVCEDGGLVLEIVTVPQFMDLLNLAIADFLRESGLLQRIWTQTVFNGQATYGIPEDLLDIQSVWLAGRWLPQSTQRELNNTLRNWRTVPGIPKFYYLDGIPRKTIGLAPAPNYNGGFILGPNEPDPPHAVYDDFRAVCQVGTTETLLNPVQHRDLTIIGTRQAITQVSALGDPIPLIPDDFALAALVFGVENRVFGGDNELHDKQRAAFCWAQFKESINVGQSISGEPGGDDE